MPIDERLQFSQEPNFIAKAIGMPFDSTPVLNEDMSKWCDEAAWPNPKWLNSAFFLKRKSKNSQQYLLTLLRSRYFRIEGDFRTFFNNYYNSQKIDFVVARRIIAMLEMSRNSLEHDNCNLIEVRDLIALAEQYMIWLYPENIASERGYVLVAKLQNQDSYLSGLLKDRLDKANGNVGIIRSVLEDVKDTLNQQERDLFITGSVQVTKLENLTKMGVIALAVFIVALPFIVHFDKEMWKDTAFSDVDLYPFKRWLITLSVGILGAAGGFFSGLLQMKNKQIQLNDYEESMSNFLLRPIIGGMAALILFIFLSWNVLPGVVFTNVGSVLFIAFLAGFSERYFLRVLNVDEEGKTPPSIANTSVSAPAISTAVVQTSQKDEAKNEGNPIVENPTTDVANENTPPPSS